MPTAFIHVGTGKTGTTSIQMALHANAGPLLERGYRILRAGQFRSDSMKQRWPWNQPDDPVWAEVVAELAEARALGQHVLLSNESLWQLGDDELSRLAHLLTGFTPRVLIYLREQADYVQAMLLQRAKAGKGEIDLADERRIERWMSRRPLDYQALCDRLETIFGSGTVRARAFRADGFVGGDLLVDVLDGLGLPELSDLYISPQTANPSVSAEFAMALTELVKVLTDRQFLAVKDLACRLTANGLGQRFFMSAAQVQRIRASFQEANDRLAAHALSGHLPLAMKPVWREAPLGHVAEYRQMLLAHEARIPTLAWHESSKLDPRCFSEGWLVEPVTEGGPAVARLLGSSARVDFRLHFRRRHRHREGVVELCVAPESGRSMPVRAWANGEDLGVLDLATQTLRFPLASTDPLDEVHLVLHSEIDPALQPPIVGLSLPVARADRIDDELA